ncbi:MAG: DUF3887 domain-containing protein [Lachnospiraceae bacterium]|nr:DUF3887 domain-containing protein [Lachnospiraceae bacterium]
MNAKQYINGIVQKIKCSGEKKKEIRKQLFTDINFRLEQGESLEDIISRMGSIKEIAEGFNENMPETEKKKYARTKTMKIIVIVFVVLILAILAAGILVNWFIPKGLDIEKSEYFEKAQVEQAMKDTIELLDREDYDALQANAIEEMISYLTEDAMKEFKTQLSKDWGDRQSIGSIYVAEVEQGKLHFAVGEVTVSYENVSVVYRLTYNTDMQLAGLYMR